MVKLDSMKMKENICQKAKDINFLIIFPRAFGQKENEILHNIVFIFLYFL